MVSTLTSGFDLETLLDSTFSDTDILGGIEAPSNISYSTSVLLDPGLFESVSLFFIISLDLTVDNARKLSFCFKSSSFIASVFFSLESDPLEWCSTTYLVILDLFAGCSSAFLLDSRMPLPLTLKLSFSVPV